MPSPVTSFAKTTATWACFAVRTAAASIPGSGGCQPRCSSLPVIDALAAYSTVIGTLCPACQVHDALEGLVRRSRRGSRHSAGGGTAVEVDPLGIAAGDLLSVDEQFRVARNLEREPVIAGRRRCQRPGPARGSGAGGKYGPRIDRRIHPGADRRPLKCRASYPRRRSPIGPDPTPTTVSTRWREPPAADTTPRVPCAYFTSMP